MNKKEIARVLEEIAILLELQGENPFKVRAYRNAARSLLNLERDLDEVIEEGILTELEGIGAHIAEKITQLAKKGKLPFYEKLRRSMPSGLLQLIEVQGIGPKKVKALYKALKIDSIEGLKKAAKTGKIAKLKGFGAKTEKNILDALEHREKYAERHLWWDAMEEASSILEGLNQLKAVKRAEVCGSLRRKLETIGDIDLLVAAENPASIVKWFTQPSRVEKVIAAGEAKASVKLKGGMQADLFIVPEKQFHFALHAFTGAKEHVIKLRDQALKRGWTLSEYGLESTTKKKGPPKISTEEGIFQAFGLPYIEPELRENLGEIEAAEKNELPVLIEERDIRGTLHNHTTASDGKSPLKEMVAAAQKMGWEYIGISDHSKSSFQANGQSEERLLTQVEEIRKLNGLQTFKIHVFAGLECDILTDGKLDFPDSVLKQLDYVIVSIHSSLQQDEKTVTRRLIRAIENPYSTIVGHLTGRLLLRRAGYPVNVAKVIDACIANKKIMELNGNPNRLDMDWRYWRKAAEKGLLCCINTDAHHADHHQFIRAGVNIARKGWLEKADVINTNPLKEMRKILPQYRRR